MIEEFVIELQFYGSFVYYVSLLQRNSYTQYLLGG